MSETGTTDAMLVARFASNGSAEAFRELVARHTGLVFGCAMQRLRDPHAAADVTQAVFLALALKAKSLSPETPLAGWLFTATRFACGKYQRGEQRRKEREMHAADHQLIDHADSAEPVWAAIEPQLAGALDSLSSRDREAVLLRYFSNATHGDVAVALHITEEAAKKRVTRALEKLRRFFTRQGVTLSVAALGGLLAANAAQAAPAGLIATASQTALAGSSGTLVATETLMLAKGALKMMFYSQLKITAAIAAATIVVAGTSVVVAQKASSSSPTTVHASGEGSDWFELFPTRFIEVLQLTAEQREQIVKMETEGIAQIKAILTPEQFRQWKQNKQRQVKSLNQGEPELTPEQQSQVRDVMKEYAEYKSEAEGRLKGILLPAQWQHYQQSQPRGLSRMASRLAGLRLTDEQWKQIEALNQDGKVFLKQGLEPILTPEQLQRMEDALGDLITCLQLTAEQRNQLQEEERQSQAELEKILTPEQLRMLH